MAAPRPLHRVNVLTGFKTAREISDPAALADLIAKARRPLLILGGTFQHYDLNERPLITYGIKLARAGRIPICATADTKKRLLDFGQKPDCVYDIMEIVHRLKDPEWKGVRKEGNHDLVIFLGFRTDIANQGLSTLKHFAPHLRTMTLCKYYYPNADYSLPNLRKDEEWARILDELIAKLAELKGVPSEELEVVEVAKAAAPEVEVIPVGVGPQYEGERVRKENLQVDFGGPKAEYKCELITLMDLGEVEHGKVEIVGPDIKDMEEGQAYPLAIDIRVAGRRLEKDMEPVLERRMHDFCNYIEGIYHMNQQDEIWIRLSKEAFAKGLNTFRIWGKILINLYTSQFPIIEKMSVRFITEPELVKEFTLKAREVYEARRARARGLKEEDVEEFYGCILCQSFAPTHVCIVTPERIANCGAMTWFDCRAAAKMDPEGPIFPIPKGECLNPIKGEYAGVNEAANKRSMGTIKRVFLHCNLEYPHTSCGCFQAICFYIPEVDGFGIVHRDFKGVTPIGKPFSTMAGEVSGGRQSEGYCGMALEYMRSRKFYQAEGGMYRVVWMPKEIKERYRDAIPEDLYDKIATEEDVSNTDELLAFLEERGHPWLRGEVELPEA